MPKQTVTPFLRGRIYWGLIPMPSGRGKGRSLGTSHIKGAVKICRFLEKMRDDSEWYLLGKLADGSASITDAFAAYSQLNLPQYIQTLKFGPVIIVDIEPYVAKWLAELERVNTPSADVREKYQQQVRTLLPAGVPFPLTKWTPETVLAWLSGLGIKSTNRHRAAASSFAKFLIAQKVCKHNHVLAVGSSKEPDPRCVYLSQRQAKAVIGAMSGLAQVYHAIVAVTAMECQAARRLRYCDIDMLNGTLLADGKKTSGRSRTASLYERWTWAWEYVVSHMTQNIDADSETLVFAELSDRGMRKALKDACERAAISDYRPHDWRHTWAVQAIRDGLPTNTVAAQLGHKDAVMTHRVYGKFIPVATDFERVNVAIAAERARDAARVPAVIDPSLADGKRISL